MTNDMIELIKQMSSLRSNKSENNTPMEIALSETLLLITKEILERTILPKRAIKPLALLNDDIFFNEKIVSYKNNLKNQKKIIKVYEGLIKAIAKGIGQESERKGILSYLKGKFTT